MTDPSPPARRRRRRERAQQPTRARRRRSTLAIAAVIVAAQVALAVALAVGLDATSLWSSVAQGKANSPADRPVDVGDCVRASEGRASYYVATPCSDGRVTGRVLAVLAGASTGTEACPEQSDFFATRPAQVICLRRTGDEHPGDPGAGGGVYRPGDCVALDEGGAIREVPCTSPAVFETLVDRVAAPTDCRRPALRFARIEHGERRVLCLGDGPGLAATGECIADPARSPVTFDAIPCQDAAARARVLARVGSLEQCGRITGTTGTVTDRSGLPGGTVVCLRTVH